MKNSNLITKVNSVEDLISLWTYLMDATINIAEEEDKVYHEALKRAAVEITFPSLRDEDSEYSKFVMKIYRDISSESIIRLQDISLLISGEYTEEEINLQNKMKEYMTTIPFMMEIDAKMKDRVLFLLDLN